jgi:hypothetical protein
VKAKKSRLIEQRAAPGTYSNWVRENSAPNCMRTLQVSNLAKKAQPLLNLVNMNKLFDEQQFVKYAKNLLKVQVYQ